MQDNNRTDNNIQQSRSPWRLFWQRFRKNKLALGGAVIILILFFVAAFAPLLVPYEPDAHSAYLHHFLFSADPTAEEDPAGA